MCAYNMVNRTFSCENPRMLGLLRATDSPGLGFGGWVMSDWNAVGLLELPRGVPPSPSPAEST